jgi:hypothetical protein
MNEEGGGKQREKTKKIGGEKSKQCTHTLIIYMYNMYMITESKPFYLMQFDAVQFDARFAVFVRRVHVLPSPSIAMQLVICGSGGFTGAVTLC